LNELVQSDPLPSLTLKTLLLVCETYPAFKNLAVSSLVELAKRDTTAWDNTVLWKGFCIACVRLQPLSFDALVALPTIQREKFFIAHGELFESFRTHLNQEKTRLEQTNVSESGYPRSFSAVARDSLPKSSSAFRGPSLGDSFFDENGELMPMWSDLKEEGIEDSTAVLTVDEDEEKRPALLSCGRPTQIRVASYVVLGESNARPERYPYVPAAVLDWETRKTKLSKEILLRRPDIVCLQQIEHYEDHFKPSLHQEGYTSLFKQRTGTAQDGVGIFWLKDRYRLVLEHKIEFNNLAFANPSNPQAHRFVRHSVALIAVLEPVQNTSRKRADKRTRLMVASVDLCREPMFEDVRAMQAKTLAETLEKLVITTKAASAPNVPVIVCGGFHVAPESGVYELMSNGQLDHNHPSVAGLKLFSPLQQRLGLKSAYKSVYKTEPPYTVFTPSQQIASDYIFYTASRLRALAALDVPARETLERDTALPSNACGSHHILLMSVLESIIDEKEQ